MEYDVSEASIRRRDNFYLWLSRKLDVKLRGSVREKAKRDAMYIEQLVNPDRDARHLACLVRAADGRAVRKNFRYYRPTDAEAHATEIEILVPVFRVDCRGDAVGKTAAGLRRIAGEIIAAAERMESATTPAKRSVRKSPQRAAARRAR